MPRKELNERGSGRVSRCGVQGGREGVFRMMEEKKKTAQKPESGGKRDRSPGSVSLLLPPRGGEGGGGKGWAFSFFRLRPHSSLRFSPGAILLVVLIFSAVLLTFLFFFLRPLSEWILFQPPPFSGGRYPEGVFFIQGEGVPGPGLAVYYLPPPSENAPVLLYSHGNAEDLRTVSGLAQFLAEGKRTGERGERGRYGRYGVFAYDYEGYGASGGTPSEEAALRDIRLCWDYLTEVLSIPAESIVIFGRSVGCGPSVWLAGRTDPMALVLDSPFTDVFSVAALGFLPGSPFPNLERIADVKAPLLVIHGERDSLIPPGHGKTLYENAPSEKKEWFPVPGAGHNSVISAAGENYRKRLANFLNSIRQGETSSSSSSGKVSEMSEMPVSGGSR